jgi:hypothetical protein
MGKRWTDKEDAILETLRAVGMTFEEIAPIMGRTKHALQQRAHMLKRNEPTFREVVDTAFEKHGIKCGEVVDTASEKHGLDKVKYKYGGRAYVHRLDTEAQAMFSQMEQDIKPKPQWWKAMMWWRK